MGTLKKTPTIRNQPLALGKLSLLAKIDDVPLE